MAKIKMTFESMPETMGLILDQIEALREELAVLSRKCGSMNASDSHRERELFDVKQVASYLNLSTHTIYKMVCEDSIPYMKTGKKLFFYRDDIKNWLKSRSGGRNDGKSRRDYIKESADSYLATTRMAGGGRPQR